MAWLPGEQGGDAIADVLVGATSPGGKLPVSYPRSSGQIPIFYAHKISGGRSHWKGAYVDESNEPLHPFGHGLSYSTFTIEPVAVTSNPVTLGERIEVRVDVTNTGTRRADEVVQVYASDPIASVTRPVRELVGFERVTLDPGARARLTFEIPVEVLGFIGVDMTYVVEPGEIEIHVGASATATVPAGSVTIAGESAVGAVRSTATRVTVSPFRLARAPVTRGEYQVFLDVTGHGAPEFWPEARYNQDINAIVNNFDIGLDEMTVIVEMDRDGCVKHEIMDTVDQFVWHMKNVDGVSTVRSLSDILKVRTMGNSEGHPKFYAIPWPIELKTPRRDPDPPED